MLAEQAEFSHGSASDRRDRCLSVSPIYYSQGLKLTILTPLITGGGIAFPASTRLDVNEWLNLLGPTWYAAGPTLHRYMFDKTKRMPDVNSIHSLRFIVRWCAPHTGCTRRSRDCVGSASAGALWVK